MPDDDDSEAGLVSADLADDPGDPEKLAGPEAPAAVLRLSAAAGAGERVDRFLAKALAGRVAGLSRTRLQHWLTLGAIACEQRTLTAATRLAGYEMLTVTPLPREADEAFAPEAMDLRVLHEDDDVLVIDKPPGLVVHPAAGHWRGTLLNGLLHHRPALVRLPRAGIVHRLDKDTSGLLVVAGSERALAALSAQLADRSMSRRYVALVEGITRPRFSIEAPVGRDPRVRTRMAVVSAEMGKAALTHVRTLAPGEWRARPMSLVECRLESGRTHQIRVHLSHDGHPLAGDPLYGGSAGLIHRQALHAWRLAFRHPDGQGDRVWHSDWPADLCQACEACGIDPLQAQAAAGSTWS